MCPIPLSGQIRKIVERRENNHLHPHPAAGNNHPLYVHVHEAGGRFPNRLGGLQFHFEYQEIDHEPPLNFDEQIERNSEEMQHHILERLARWPGRQIQNRENVAHNNNFRNEGGLVRGGGHRVEIHNLMTRTFDWYVPRRYRHPQPQQRRTRQQQFDALQRRFIVRMFRAQNEEQAEIRRIPALEDPDEMYIEFQQIIDFHDQIFLD